MQVQYAKVFEEYKKKLNDDAEYSCCSCERLLTKASDTQFTIDTKKFTSNQWLALKTYLAERDEDINSKVYYVCTYCCPLLNQNKLPNRCVLNSLYVEPVPEELSGLNDNLSSEPSVFKLLYA